MPILMLDKDAELGALLEQHFGKLTKAERERLSRLTLEQNPHLGPNGKIDKGSIVLLPSIRAEAAVPSTPIAALAKKLDSELETYVKDLRAKISLRGDRLREVGSLLTDSEFLRAMKPVEGGGAALKKLQESLDEQGKGLAELKALLAGDLVAELLSDLAGLGEELQ